MLFMKEFWTCFQCKTLESAWDYRLLVLLCRRLGPRKHLQCRREAKIQSLDEKNHEEEQGKRTISDLYKLFTLFENSVKEQKLHRIKHKINEFFVVF